MELKDGGGSVMGPADQTMSSPGVKSSHLLPQAERGQGPGEEESLNQVLPTSILFPSVSGDKTDQLSTDEAKDGELETCVWLYSR